MMLDNKNNQRYSFNDLSTTWQNIGSSVSPAQIAD
jgi:hypothetical protein